MAYVSRRDRCCFCHVKVGVEVLGWVGVGFNTVAFIRSLCHHSTSSSVGAILGILLFVGLIVARRIDNHRWYLPFLILNGLYLVLAVIAFTMLSVLLIAGRQDELIRYYLWDDSHTYEITFRQGNYATMMFAFLAVGIAWTGCCEYFVSRAYRSIKRESVVPMPPPVIKA